MDVVARYDESTHDSRICRESKKKRALFEQGVYEDAVLVGDGGYVSTSYMTPLYECHTLTDQLYNES